MSQSSDKPFEGRGLHETVNLTGTESEAQDREAFNNAIKHGDIVRGFQAPKRLDQFPAWYRNPRRWYALISVLIFASFMAYQVYRIITEIAAGH